MWPWEHATFGYLLLSVGRRVTGRDPPVTGSALTLLLGTQIPDLVDKPLSWGLHVFPSGYAIGHSVFVEIPLGVLLLYLGHRRDRYRLAVAFVLGDWSHLLADVFTPLRTGGPPDPGRILWPVVRSAAYGHELGLRRGLIYLARLWGHLLSLDAPTLVLLYLSIPALTLLLWIADGMPGLDLVTRWMVRR